MATTYFFALFFSLVATAFAQCPEGQGSFFGGECEICPPGFGSENGFCVRCDPNTFKPNEGVGSCQPCPPNAISVSGASECIVCGPGFRQAPFVFGECEECESGFFKPDEGLGDCQRCPPNTFSSFGAAECTSCPDGQVFLGSGTCGTCPPGSFYDQRQFCALCPAGTFTCTPNTLSECHACAPNSFAGQGSTGCTECAQGQVLIRDSNGSSSCAPCPSGTRYSESFLSCDECAVNSISAGGRQTVCNRCETDTFARRGSSSCFSCPPDTFYIERSDRCEACTEGRRYSASRAECVFPRNTGLSLISESQFL